jgi:hypothetical protein
LAESVTKGIDGACVTSVINTLEKDITIDAPVVEMEELDESIHEEAMVFASSTVDAESRLSKLHRELRTDHLNSEERISLTRICEDYSDVFHLQGDRLTFTTAVEHAIPTPTIDPTVGINVKNYRIS